MKAIDLILDRQRQSHTDGVLSMWTVYDHPDDFPHSYVARRYEVTAAGPTVTSDIVQGELDVIRKSFEHCGLTCIARDEGDDAYIVETWL